MGVIANTASSSGQVDRQGVVNRHSCFGHLSLPRPRRSSALQFLCPYPPDQRLWAAPTLHPGRLEQFPGKYLPIQKSTRAAAFMYCMYICTRKRETCERVYSTRRGDYALRELHTKQNGNTLGGGYTWRGLHTMQNENKREAESTLESVGTKRALHGGDHRRGRAQLEETTYGRDYAWRWGNLVVLLEIWWFVSAFSSQKKFALQTPFTDPPLHITHTGEP